MQKNKLFFSTEILAFTCVMMHTVNIVVYYSMTTSSILNILSLTQRLVSSLIISDIVFTCHVDQLVYIMLIFSIIKIMICYCFHILQVGKENKGYHQEKKIQTVLHRQSLQVVQLFHEKIFCNALVVAQPQRLNLFQNFKKPISFISMLFPLQRDLLQCRVTLFISFQKSTVSFD